MTSIDPDRQYWHARGLFNKGVTLGALGRSDDEIAVYDDLLARFGASAELPLRELVAEVTQIKTMLRKLTKPRPRRSRKP